MFEGWLLSYAQKSDGQHSAGAVSAMARAVLDEWRLAHSLGDFKAWLDRGAPSDDADAGSAAQPASNGSLLNSKSEFRNPETISKFEIEPKTQVRIDVVWNIESFCHLILFRASDF